MALYKGKKQKRHRGNSAYAGDYRTRQKKRHLKIALTVIILLGLFALGFFVIEPWIERRMSQSDAGRQEQTASDAEPEATVIDVKGLFSE